MSSPNKLPRPDHSRGTGALLLAHLLVTTRYRFGRLVAATRGGSKGCGPHIASMSGAGSASTDVGDICDRVLALNESVQRQLEEVNKRYIELQERHKKEKEKWTQ